MNKVNQTHHFALKFSDLISFSSENNKSQSRPYTYPIHMLKNCKHFCPKRLVKTKKGFCSWPPKNVSWPL